LKVSNFAERIKIAAKAARAMLILNITERIWKRALKKQFHN
jgi:hypothetical protein